MADLINEPLTEGVGETQLAPAPIQAYSEEIGEWRTPPWHYPAYSRWRILGSIAKYTAPAIAGAGAAVLAFALSSHQTTPAPTPVAAPITTTVTAPPPTASPIPATDPASPKPTPTVDDNFMAALINHDAPINKLYVAVNNAKAVCDELNQGKTRPDITNEIRDNTDGYTETNAATFVALAVDYYCPKRGVIN